MTQRESPPLRITAATLTYDPAASAASDVIVGVYGRRILETAVAQLRPVLSLSYWLTPPS
ncbi:Hypothetical protein SMAX5B_022547 [Scophthalmus maximus]|uniref:Uncharacterized protein n=1 Tax=Scophthalmus maximus TaxID=52904 RepID=A0A2U9C2F4_SCOMX|nr:Hypothetical protein SMAX5B_022547 [Scophthalmus maximus]